MATRVYVWFLDEAMMPLQYPTHAATLAITLPVGQGISFERGAARGTAYVGLTDWLDDRRVDAVTEANFTSWPICGQSLGRAAPHERNEAERVSGGNGLE